MKRSVVIILYFLVILFLGCKEEKDEVKNIEVLTGENEYLIGHEIDVSVINKLGKQVNYFRCDNVDFGPNEILVQEDGFWKETGFSIACTQMGLMGYWGVLSIGETQYDTLTISEFGIYKLRYRFVSGNDTLDVDSNEFTIKGLEL